MQVTNPKKEVFICEMLAQSRSYDEISKGWAKLSPEDKPLTKQAIYYYIKTHKNKIEDMRQKFIEKTVEKAMEVPIANEKVRLMRMEDLYQVSTTMLKKKDMVTSSLECLREARQEVKGDTGSTQNYLQLNQFNELTNEQLLEKKRELEQKFLELSKKGDNYALQEKG